jgi:hypothetical protein
MRFAKWVFLIAGVYGVLALLPQYFVKPSADRPDFFYGFIGIALAWQIVFILIAREPVRFRPLMAVAVLEKVSFGIPALILFSQGRIPRQMLLAGSIDLLLAVLFTVSWLRTSTSGSSS